MSPLKLRLSFRAIALLCIASLFYALLPNPIRACGSGTGRSSDVTNSGSDFLLCFEQNELPSVTGYQEIYFASLQDSSTITISCLAYPSYTKKIVLGPNQSTTYRISDDINPSIDGSEIVDGHAVRVLASSPIVCYGMNHKQYTADAFLALPRNIAGLEYRVMSYPNSNVVGAAPRPSEFAVAAFSNGTVVTIIPKAQTVNGVGINTPITVTLDSGQCYQVQASDLVPGADLTGSIVRATNPVVVFGGHVRAEVPNGFILSGPLGSTSRDHLIEQLAPVTAWGKLFAMTNFAPTTQGDVVRVLAVNGNTQVSLNGKPWVVLGSEEYHDTLIFGPTQIESSEPVMVSEYAHTTNVDRGLGDPFMAIVAPLNETFNRYTYFTSTDPSYTIQNVIIVTEISGKGAITLDGQPIPVSAYTDLATPMGGKRYSVATVPSSPGSHQLVSPSLEANGFTILAYGFGPADSYGYTAGGLYKPQRALYDHSAIPMITARSRPTLTLRNMLDEVAYMDSATIEIMGGTRMNSSIHLDRRIWQDVSRLSPGQEVELHLVSDEPITDTVNGTLTIYNEVYQWGSLEPLRIPFTMVAPEAAVAQPLTRKLRMQSFPNPSTGSVAIAVENPADQKIVFSVIDDLGRIIATTQASLAAGSSNYVLPFVLENGHYVLTATSHNGFRLAQESIVVIH